MWIKWKHGIRPNNEFCSVTSTVTSCRALDPVQWLTTMRCLTSVLHLITSCGKRFTLNIFSQVSCGSGGHARRKTSLHNSPCFAFVYGLLYENDGRHSIRLCNSKWKLAYRGGIPTFRTFQHKAAEARFWEGWPPWSSPLFSLTDCDWQPS